MPPLGVITQWTAVRHAGQSGHGHLQAAIFAVNLNGRSREVEVVVRSPEEDAERHVSSSHNSSSSSWGQQQQQMLAWALITFLSVLLLLIILLR